MNDEQPAAREPENAGGITRIRRRRCRFQDKLWETRRKLAERADRRASTVWLPALGICVYGGEVCSHGNLSGRAGAALAWVERRRGMPTKLLGLLAGSRADVVGGRARVADARLVTGVAGLGTLLADMSRTGFHGVARVTFADGTFHEQKLADVLAFERAQAEASRFNTMATAVRCL